VPKKKEAEESPVRLWHWGRNKIFGEEISSGFEMGESRISRFSRNIASKTGPRLYL